MELTERNSKQIKMKSVQSSTVTGGEIKWTNKNVGKTSQALEITQIPVTETWTICGRGVKNATTVI